jgi:hypothetical protein
MCTFTVVILHCCARDQGIVCSHFCDVKQKQKTENHKLGYECKQLAYLLTEPKGSNSGDVDATHSTDEL